MKRAGKILSLVTLIVVLSTSLCFAGELTLKESYPKDGATGASIENLGVKLYFDSSMTAEKAGKVNADVFTLTGPDGKKLPTRVLYPEKEDGVVLVLLDTTADLDKDGTADYQTAVSNSEYKLMISGDLTDDNGNTLGQDQTITFTTINQQIAIMVNMLMMVVMFGGMMFLSTKQAKKAAQEAGTKQKEEAFNPYKEAKRTGKSVAEVIEQHEKEVARQERKAKRAAKDEEDDVEWIDVNTYRVSRKRPISEGGGTYITGRKALAEAKAAEAAARKAQKAAAKRNVKKGKGKKKK